MVSKPSASAVAAPAGGFRAFPFIGLFLFPQDLSGSIAGIQGDNNVH